MIRSLPLAVLTREHASRSTFTAKLPSHCCPSLL